MNQGLLGYVGPRNADPHNLYVGRWSPWTYFTITTQPGNGTCNLASGTIICWPMFVPGRVTYDAWYCTTSTGQTGTTGAQITIGLYDGDFLAPGQLIHNCGTLTTTATGFVEYTTRFGPVTLDAGVVWVAALASNYGATAPSWRCWNSTQLVSPHGATFATSDDMITTNAQTAKGQHGWRATGVSGLPADWQTLSPVAHTRADSDGLIGGGFRIARPR